MSTRRIETWLPIVELSENSVRERRLTIGMGGSLKREGGWCSF
ncbi:MAG: hypothetical protein QG599_1368 [Pseudomonadota bacterium]|nr:hypothetical protein [Pseudomonadota bacterium]